MYSNMPWLLFAIPLVFASPLPETNPAAPQKRDDVSLYKWMQIDSSCHHDTRLGPDTGFSNRYDYYNRAIADMHEIAQHPLKWPQLGTDASDLYFGKGLKDSQWKDEVVANLQAASQWPKAEWGFDNGITLTCHDPWNACGGKIGSDPRKIACYVNNTLAGTVNPHIHCCGPFFTLPTNQQIYNQEKGKTDLKLDYMMTSGAFLLHELYHVKYITDPRRHIVDQTFTGGSARRIYGVRDVAKAARVESLEVTTNNAESYAVFSTAMFWKDVFQGNLPHPTAENELRPLNWEEFISDGDSNY